MITEGKKVPSFSLQSSSGEKITSKALLGTQYILFFYPRDQTPGCTKEVCSFRDTYQKFKRKKIKVFGVSPDTIQSHEKFIQKQNLPYELLSDPDHKIAEKFGAWGEKKLYGKKYMGILRSTFVISEKGKIIKIYPKVSVATHGQDILDDVKNMS